MDLGFGRLRFSTSEYIVSFAVIKRHISKFEMIMAWYTYRSKRQLECLFPVKRNFYRKMSTALYLSQSENKEQELNNIRQLQDALRPSEPIINCSFGV